MIPMEHFSYEYIILAWALVTAAAISLFMVDDLFVDLCALLFNLKAKPITSTLRQKIEKAPEKRIAVLVANWREHEVLSRMISGNIRSINYHNYSFFIGVYPNDPLTWEAASQLEKQFSNVHVIVNPIIGPTTKGQMLNEMMQKINSLSTIPYEIFVMHDSEDLIHSYSFKLFNYFSDQFSFMQVPVFSLPTPWNHWTAGVYADEFAESHLKEMLVRDFLGGGVPSAGVGTAMTRQLIQVISNVQDGQFLRSDCLTEDYVLGLTAHQLKFKASFLNYYLEENNQRDYIATREYFPDEFHSSVRQKTRWATGIAFQGQAVLKWQGTLAAKYFLWRDRRSFLNAILVTSSIFLIPLFILGLRSPYFDILSHSDAFIYLGAINLASMMWRLFQRGRFMYSIYGIKLLPGIPIRWIVGNLINTAAAFKAFQNFRHHVKSGEQMKWVKTTHRIPENFGTEFPIQHNQTQPRQKNYNQEAIS
ncbi:MAG: hypothetical protein A2622_13225 [Bdellovibrionales bacterium RIFCSPHIGHO2_01_FULL_40_29]|nr:MAG: hypothetical protein A2622_13225 [Bdellovibrionales bacterium RIFCSPHIGHO2_01_FULL_40_29]OFZ33350.1 MAG: hypothetical protein A3D17_13660 [Bdellovibrionales bacterium RIFCSPHIGHO2_02_FULL_40_15]